MDKQKPRCICSHRYLRAFDHWNRSHHWHNGRLHCSGFSLFETSLADTLKNHLSIMGTFLQPNSWCDFAGVCVCVLLLTNICEKWFLLILTNICVKWSLYLVAICDLGWALRRFHLPAAPWSCQFARTSKTWQRLRVRFGHWSFRNETSTRKALKSSVGELHGIVVPLSLLLSLFMLYSCTCKYRLTLFTYRKICV